MIILAIVFPWLYFLIRSKSVSAILCFVLQITGIGWIIAAVWAVNNHLQDRQLRKNENIIREVLGSHAINIYS
jgi:hypothetical protein